MNLKKVIEAVTPKRKQLYIWVKETRVGLETFAEQDSLSSLPSPLKKQVKAFLEACISELK